MNDDSGNLPIGSSKLLIVLVIAVIVVMLGTIMLNGGLSTSKPEAPMENNTTDVNVDTSTIDYKMVGKNSYGTVTKISGFGNPSSDVRGALILGVDSKQKSTNAIVPTLQNDELSNYCFDVYIINTTSSTNNNSDENNTNTLSVNEMSESLASEYVVPDIIKNNYNFTVDIHSTNDSNSYIFVPSDDTYTSKSMVEYISSNTGVGRYTPDNHAYTKSISEKIISNNIPSIVYVTKEYYADGMSNEVNSVLLAIDDFDFVNLFSSDDSSVTSAVETNNQSEKTITFSNSSGNKEVN